MIRFTKVLVLLHCVSSGGSAESSVGTEGGLLCVKLLHFIVTLWADAFYYKKDAWHTGLMIFNVNVCIYTACFSCLPLMRTTTQPVYHVVSCVQ